MVEELRIGKPEGEPEYTLGVIQCLLPLPDRGVVVFDGSVPTLRVFDGSGKFVRNLGRKGAGPGEYQDACLGLVVDREGVVSMYDPRNARLNRYDRGGNPVPAVRVPAGLFTASQNLVADTAGQLYVKVMLSPPEPGRDWRFGFARVFPESARRDTIPFPTLPGSSADERRFGPQKHHAWSPLGYFVVGYSDRYAIHLLRSPRDLLRIERQIPRVAVGAEERDDWSRFLEVWRRHLSGSNRDQPIPTVASPKAPFSDLRVDADGRIWVKLSTRARKDPDPDEPQVIMGVKVPVITWIEDPVFDVFQPDGTYLGQIALPPKASLYYASGDAIWVVQLGELGEAYVVRYRIAH